MYWLQDSERQFEITEEEYNTFLKTLKKKRANKIQEDIELLIDAVGYESAKIAVLGILNDVRPMP